MCNYFYGRNNSKTISIKNTVSKLFIAVSEAVGRPNYSDIGLAACPLLYEKYDTTNYYITRFNYTYENCRFCMSIPI